MTKAPKPAAAAVVPSSSAGLQPLRGAKKSKIVKKAKSKTSKKAKTAINDDKARNDSTTGVDSLNSLHGLEKWVSEYQAQRPGLKVLETQLDEYMAEYDAKVKEAAEESAKQAAKDEGWTVVVSKRGRKKNADGSGITVGAVAALKAADTQPKAKHLSDFYRFQQREARRNELLELRHKFEEDRRKIAKLKAARKFKPY
ncbi:hypothetical protein CBR_g4867 [Chara braunii]|uniref:Ribosomal RNA-processing protein 7 C-terminal domain-containing protein n=1 Tax=Chara braunii TaxID=69332 RepID=A0A388KJ26_CHABU|nr:hypothetical protein CBR_g4867 [Chara braunii]|eukprot:GBG70039.1 hypothetical protein CBR_g4867 [Chara braunii]